MDIWIAFISDLMALADVMSIADKKVIVDKFAIPLDINLNFNNALMKFLEYQIRTEEIQEFYLSLQRNLRFYSYLG
jgi:hypothetical protein